jgi:hypothetical protein
MNIEFFGDLIYVVKLGCFIGFQTLPIIYMGLYGTSQYSEEGLPI